MEKFVAELYDRAYDKLTIQYHNDVNELEMQKRSMEGAFKSYDLSFQPVVPLPEFDTQEITLDDNIVAVDFFDDTTILVHFAEHINVMEVSTGNNLRILPRDFRFRYYRNKRVITNSDRYEETDVEVRIPQERDGYTAFYARDKDGRVQPYELRSHLLSHNVPFHFDDELWVGDHCVRVLRNLHTEETTAFFVGEGRMMCFQYRDHWYQYGGSEEEGKLWHCRSRESLPCPWGRRKLLVHGDCIILWGPDYSNTLQILRPREE